MPRFSHALLAENTDGLVALSGCREGEIARRLRVGDREGARAAAEGKDGVYREIKARLLHKHLRVVEEPVHAGIAQDLSAIGALVCGRGLGMARAN